MIKKIKRFLDERKEKKLAEDYLEMTRTAGKIEGLAVRERFANFLQNEGRYYESAKMWEEMGKIAEQYPESRRDSEKYFDKFIKLKNMSDSLSEKNLKSSYWSGFFAFISFMIILLGIVFLSPNFTGSAVLNPQTDVSNWLGVGFLILGSILAIAYILRK